MSTDLASRVVDDPRPLDGLRLRVLTVAARVTAVAAPLLSLMIFLRAQREGRVNGILIALCAYTLAFPVLLAFLRRIGVRAGGAVYLMLMLTMAFTVQARGGASVGAAALQLLILVLSGILFGGRGAALALFANLLCFALAGVLVVGGYVPPIHMVMWDPHLPGLWLRGGTVLTLFGGAAAFAVTYTVARLEEAATLAQAALYRERAQRDALEQAEQEKMRASAAMDEAQRVEALGRMAGGVAHDFNNLLTVILGTCEIARTEANLPESARAYLEDIGTAALRGAEITRSLLVLGRRDLARPVPTDVPALLARLLVPMRRLLPSDVRLDLAPCEPVSILVDATGLERVLLNLAVNARDAIGGAGRIELDCRVQTLSDGELGLPGGAYVCISVRDDGQGMDEETQKRIFEPFFTTKPAGVGTGMGLALVRSFVSDAGGAVQLVSAPRQGTTVTLVMPRLEPSERPSEPSGARKTEGGPDPAALDAVPGSTILLVEDNAPVLANTRRVLERAGYRVLEAEDGDRALAFVVDRDVSIDLLCIDGVIPGASAAEVIASARAQRPGIPIVVCSGYVDEELLRRGIRMGELVCVRKPYTGAQLLACLRQQLAVGTGAAP